MWKMILIMSGLCALVAGYYISTAPEQGPVDFPKDSRAQSSFATNEERLEFLRGVGLNLDESCQPIVEDLVYEVAPALALEFTLIDDTGQCPTGSKIMTTVSNGEIYWLNCGWLGVSENKGFYFCSR